MTARPKRFRPPRTVGGSFIMRCPDCGGELVVQMACEVTFCPSCKALWNTASLVALR
jgi:hypothetical protein